MSAILFMPHCINLLAHRSYGRHFGNIIFKINLQIDTMVISLEVALVWMPQNTFAAL